ncbi:BBE domain-containing protein [Lysinibacillus sp. NPDC056959]|uniref:BBE domain-containing protein n=1 Tax=Lysinibacillus sp. NPDC056959 TaxID=3345981 RepID=UPI003625E4CF
MKDWPNAYYVLKLRILREVKGKYDPFNVFNFPQSIPPPALSPIDEDDYSVGDEENPTE